MASPAKSSNFTASEISVLTVKVDENLSVLQSKLTNSITRGKIEYGAASTVREKWKNLHSQDETFFLKYILHLISLRSSTIVFT